MRACCYKLRRPSFGWFLAVPPQCEAPRSTLHAAAPAMRITPALAAQRCLWPHPWLPHSLPGYLKRTGGAQSPGLGVPFPAGVAWHQPAQPGAVGNVFAQFKAPASLACNRHRALPFKLGEMACLRRLLLGFAATVRGAGALQSAESLAGGLQAAARWAAGPAAPRNSGAASSAAVLAAACSSSGGGCIGLRCLPCFHTTAACRPVLGGSRAASIAAAASALQGRSGAPSIWHRRAPLLPQQQFASQQFRARTTSAHLVPRFRGGKVKPYS